MTAGTRAVATLAVLARVVLGAAWVAEGWTKLHAHFGAADVGFIVDGAVSDPRTPAAFAWTARHLLAPVAGVAGVLIPWWELALGVLLILGLGTRTVAFLAAGTLAVYWTADLLIARYPVMAVLSALVLLCGRHGAGWTLPGLLRRRRSAGHPPDAAASGSAAREPAGRAQPAPNPAPYCRRHPQGCE